MSAGLQAEVSTRAEGNGSPRGLLGYASLLCHLRHSDVEEQAGPNRWGVELARKRYWTDHSCWQETLPELP